MDAKLEVYGMNILRVFKCLIVMIVRLQCFLLRPFLFDKSGKCITGNQTGTFSGSNYAEKHSLH